MLFVGFFFFFFFFFFSFNKYSKNTRKCVSFWTKTNRILHNNTLDFFVVVVFVVFSNFSKFMFLRVNYQT